MFSIKQTGTLGLIDPSLVSKFFPLRTCSLIWLIHWFLNFSQVTFQELLSFLERKGVGIQTRFLGYTRKEIHNLSDFISTLQVRYPWRSINPLHLDFAFLFKAIYTQNMNEITRNFIAGKKPILLFPFWLYIWPYNQMNILIVKLIYNYPKDKVINKIISIFIYYPFIILVFYSSIQLSFFSDCSFYQREEKLRGGMPVH